MKNAEQETLLRLEHCFNKQGHDLVVFDKDGFVITEGADKGKYIEETNPDFMFTYNTLDLAVITYPDIFSMFFHWSPLGFVANFQTLLEIKAFNSYDTFGCTYEQDVFNRICNITTYDIPFIGSSVPLDFSLSARKQTDRKLFYVGINFERSNAEKMRYGKLLQNLDKSKQIEIYGPREVYGIKNLWAGFDCYKGEIPFDGKSIIEKINQAGCCLAINSPMHNDANGVSNRTYEAAAAGALIISDDNKFVRDYFGDSVFYIDNNLPEEEASQKILDILNWSNEHPDEAYEMAKRSNEIFKKKLALDNMVKDTIDAIKKNKTAICDAKKQNKVIDVICFAYSQNDYDKVCAQIARQYYKNINMIVISNQDLKIHKNDTFVKTDLEFKGRAFLQAIPLLKGEFFMFIDADSVMHQRHIYKNADILQNFDTLFAYSGCYLKKDKGYITLNSHPILRDEFLSFSLSYGIDWHKKDEQFFLIETMFSRSCALFKKEILNIIDKDEISHISDSVHFYLACCSIIKASKLGRFSYACTTGYVASSVQDVAETVFAKSRKHWNSNCRSAKTCIKEMNEVFFKYTFETTPNFICLRSEKGEALSFKDYLSIFNNDSLLSTPITGSKWMTKLLKKAYRCDIKRMPRFIYEQFSAYCKIKKLFRKIFRK